MVVLESPARLSVQTDADLARAERFARTLDPDALLRRPTARSLQADSLAWLTGAPAGRAFLAAASPRAIARGAPADSCPVTGLATPADLAATGTRLRGGEARAAVVRLAIERCRDALSPAAAGPEGGCGCALVALDTVLTVPQSDMAYATGITARIRAPSVGIDGVLIAEEEETGAILLRDLRRPVARLLPSTDETARLVFLDGGPEFSGRREAVGFRRGRLAERIYLSDGAGRRAVVLIGFSPSELAESAAAGLAWPQGG